MDQAAQLLAALENNGLGSLAAEILALAKPAVQFTVSRRPDAGIPIGSTKVGGDPDLPSDLDWPLRESGRPLSFIAQFDCAELRRVQPRLQLVPDAGLLSFFYDTIRQPWGFDPRDRDASRVLHVPAGTGVTRRCRPPVDPGWALQDGEHVIEPWYLEACEVSLTPVVTWPDWVALEISGRFDRDGERRYAAAMEEAGVHSMDDFMPFQFGGHSKCIQDEMRPECALFDAGLRRGGPQEETAEMARVRTTAFDWHLLLQFAGCDEETDGHGVMWGCCGCLYFWCHEDSIRSGTFDRRLAIIQGT